MSLAPGVRLGPYEIVGALGAGGMGEVYRARDTRLDRTVALKVLPAHFASDPQARERFEREARAAGALNHPNVCTLHDIGRESPDGKGTCIDFLVMEYLEGETLAARLVKGPLGHEQALTCAIQIASALDRAHRAGLVHRDVKPGNIMLTKGGAKLLDFGIALPAPTPRAGETTFHARRELTDRGVVLGTVQYMAPEQIEGRAIDARTDVFAFGAMLFEMVTGKKAFQGNSQASVMAAIVDREAPRLSLVQPLVPAGLDHVLAMCLAKDPDDRWQTSRDLLHELTWVRDGATSDREATERVARGRSRWIWPVSAVAVTAGLLAWAGTSAWGTSAAPPVRDVRFSVYPERGSTFSTAPASVLSPQFALSHDGNSLAFVATLGGRDVLWVRRLGGLSSSPLPGTEGAIYPFWSPNHRSIAFFAQGRLKVVSVDGGPAVTVTDASFDSRGGAWAPDGTLLVNLVSNGGLWRVLTTGSAELIAPLDEANDETSLRWPSFLPDSRHFLAVARSPNEARRGVYLQDMATRIRTRLVAGDWGAAAIGGHLLFVRGRTLMAQPLDVAQRRLTGEPRPLLDGVGSTTNGYSAFSTSWNGTIAYSESWPTLGQLIWFDRNGQQLGQPVASLADYVDFALAPGGRRLAVSRVDPQSNTSDLWLLDLASGVEARLTADPMNDAGPMWSPDESSIYFRSNRRGVNSLYLMPANGSRAEGLLFEQRGEASSSLMPSSLSADGTRLLYTDSGLRSSFDVWSLSLDGTPKGTPLLRGPFNEFQGALSPDGRWMAYVSDETGAPQVYVRSFPGGEQRQQVSSRGGTEPQFRSDSRELFFLDGNRMLMAAPVSQGPSLVVGLPVSLFRTRVPATGNPYRRPYIAAADGQRFLVNTTPADAAVPAIQLILDWRALLGASQD